MVRAVGGGAAKRPGFSRIFNEFTTAIPLGSHFLDQWEKGPNQWEREFPP